MGMSLGNISGSPVNAITVMMFVIKHLWANYSSPITFRSKYTFYKFHWGIPEQCEGFSCGHPYNIAEVNKLCKKFKEGHQSLILWSPDIYPELIYMCGGFCGTIMSQQYLVGSTYLANMLSGSWLWLLVGKNWVPKH